MLPLSLIRRALQLSRGHSVSRLSSPHVLQTRGYAGATEKVQTSVRSSLLNLWNRNNTQDALAFCLLKASQMTPLDIAQAEGHRLLGLLQSFGVVYCDIVHNFLSEVDVGVKEHTR